MITLVNRWESKTSSTKLMKFGQTGREMKVVMVRTDC